MWISPLFKKCHLILIGILTTFSLVYTEYILCHSLFMLCIYNTTNILVQLYVNIYIYIHTFVYIYTYIYIHIYIYTYRHIYIYVYIYIYVHTFIHTDISGISKSDLPLCRLLSRKSQSQVALCSDLDLTLSDVETESLQAWSSVAP